MSGSSANALVPPLLVLLIVVASDIWVYADAKAHTQRGTHVAFSTRSFEVDTPEAWLLGSVLLWIVFFPLYLTSRNRAD
jgi:hypothetical protein